jgi:VanZ family protein
MVEMMSAPKDRALTMMLYVITVLYMVMIFTLSSFHNIQQPGPLDDLPSVDKIEHAGEYFVLGLLLALCFQRTPSMGPNWQSLALGLLIGIIYGFSDELHQSFVSGRSSDLLDLLADSTGVTFGCLFGAWVEGRSSEDGISHTIPLKKGSIDSEE